jgi:ribosomal protein S18 acetylase RimI-like enzyme
MVLLGYNETEDSHMKIRVLKYNDIPFCERLVLDQGWGQDAADRFHAQALASIQGSQPMPYFFVAYDEDKPKVILGFGGYRATWIMRDFFDLIWLVVADEARGKGVGRALTHKRLDEIRRRGGVMVSLVTQKIGFFEKIGFRVIEEFNDGWTRMSYNMGLEQVKM